MEQNNVKGDKRFFLPRPEEIDWDEAAGQLIIPFEYRPLTEQEDITYGQKNQQEADHRQGPGRDSQTALAEDRNVRLWPR